MIVRIRLSHGPRETPDAGGGTQPSLVPEVAALPEPGKVRPQEAAEAASMVLAPVCWSLWAMACWRLAADMRIAGPFFLSEGLFSHWQVWFTLGLGVHTAVKHLRRRALG